jgi:hypothetical protein
MVGNIGISITVSTLTSLSGGQGKRATSSTAASPSVEPSMANKIFIETLLGIFPRLTDVSRAV